LQFLNEKYEATIHPFTKILSVTITVGMRRPHVGEISYELWQKSKDLNTATK